MYIAVNLPAPINPTRNGLSCLSWSLAKRFTSTSKTGTDHVFSTAGKSWSVPDWWFESGGFQLVVRGAVLPGQRDVVILEQAIVGQALDGREVAVRDVAGALEAADVVRHRAEREINAHAIPRRKVGGRGVHQAAVEQDHRAGRTLGRDDAAVRHQLGDGVVRDHPERIAGGAGVVLR